MQNAKNKWFISALFIAVVGLGLSTYSTYHHILLKAQGKTEAICNINSKLNCDSVAASTYSEYFGVPLGIYGFGYFLGLVVLLLTGITAHKSSKENIPAYAFLVAIGLIVSIALAVISGTVIKTWCLVCLGIYTTCFAQAGLLFLNRQYLKDYSFKFKVVGSGLTTSISVIALVIVAYNFLGPQSTLPHHMQDLPGKVDVDRPLDTNITPSTSDIPINRSAYSGLGEDYRTGSDQAKVVLVEFADFQCPACATFASTLKEIDKRFGNQISIVFKNFPLDNTCNSSIQSAMHPFACLISTLARCAGQYGKFWEYYHMAFQNQSKASESEALQWAKGVGLTDEQIKTCRASSDILAKIKDDIGIANKVGIDGTPTLFINGHKYIGPKDFQSLERYIQSLL